MRVLLACSTGLSTSLAGMLIAAQPASAQTAQPATQSNEQTAAAAATDPNAPTATSTQATDPNAPPPAPTAGGPTIDSAAQNENNTVVVTGSRIRSPNLTSVVPVTTISGEDFFKTGQTSIGDVLNQLPALRSTFSQANSTRFLGTSGLNLLDLRGLGTQRTLVLVNGRRHVAGDILNSASSVDTNTIPTDLIDRTDIITGGDSAVYGSDALAGVVNFVLKDHYSGVQLRAQDGISPHGDAGNSFISLLAGKNFADGRGNVAVNLEYAHQADFYASDRAAYRTVNGFVQINENGSATAPQNDYFRDIRNGFYTNAGTFLTYLGGDSYTPFIFQPDATLIQQTGTPVGLAPFPSYLGGNGDNFRDGKQFAFRPKLDRYNANIVGHFEMSPAFVPFIEGSYSRTDSFGSASGPFFTASIGDTYNINNPYLTDQARGIIRDYYTMAYADDPSFDPNNFDFTFYKNAVDLTNRSEKARRQTYRGVVGVRGDFNGDWNYEVSANYGKFTENTAILGNINLQRYLLAIDAVDQGLATGGTANGNIVCRSRVDPTAASTYGGADQTFANAELANDVASCVPLNLFGNGKVTDAARNYLLQNSYARGRITQFDINGFVNGDTSGFFNFQGGPIGFVVGGEYRRETAFYKQDAATAAGLTFYNAIPEFNPTAFEVKEAFGEIRFPIFKDLPFARLLTVSAAARVSDYKGSTGTVASYNGGVEWSPVRSLRLRGNYSRAVRAPNLSDLYTPLGQNYFQFSDPCSQRNLGSGSQYRTANCRAAGVPVGYDYVYRSTPGYLSGGNSNLQAETSNSFTVGGVFAPTQGFLRGFSASADYYNIKVKNVINSPSAQGIIDACYDLPTLNNQFCSLFTRDTTVGLTAPEYVQNSLRVIPLNYAKLKTSGIDFDVGYQHKFGRVGDLSLRMIYTLSLSNSNFLDPTNPAFEDRTLSELGQPRNRFTFNAGLRTGPFVISYKLRYVGPMFNGAYEDYNSLQGRPPENPYQYPAAYRLYPAITYHDARIEFDVSKNSNFYLGVDNLFDQLPPFGLTGAGGGSGIYDNVGRFFYAGVQAKF
ncbi:TonB-dependent receptor [Sphingomonas sp. KRR8]|uniref:TonB-dependent receptor domain-containing protein n=1 Tax=Sphingomonas sp. KRR8 TaxID=2942996 RepID=UPI0020223143|nr:TonB-dependent receptor [Sphingomonas sp. KRR8]URD61863.1 TonB-dependent receptor [Sphingomonas sp. KRR8]